MKPSTQYGVSSRHQTPPPSPQPAVVVRFCPRVFRRRRQIEALQGAAEAITTPYRMVFAVATLDSIILYDTEVRRRCACVCHTAPPELLHVDSHVLVLYLATTHMMQLAAPFALLGGLHFAAITDLSWSTDGQFLVASSRDGYCSIVAFDDGELGEVVPNAEMEAAVAKRMLAVQKCVRPLEPAHPLKAVETPGAVARSGEAVTPVVAPAVGGDAKDAGDAGDTGKRRIVPTAVPMAVPAPVADTAPPSSDGVVPAWMCRLEAILTHRCRQATYRATKDVTW